VQYRLYRFTPTNTAYAIVPRSKVELLQYLMKNGEYGEIRDITEELRWFETLATWEYVAGAYKVLAELDGDELYILAECPW
jgi:hypothetical protein